MHPQLIYIVGYHHSGTTILRKVIGNHYNVCDFAPERLIETPPPHYKNETHFICKKPRVKPQEWKPEFRIVSICRDFRDVYHGLQLRDPKKFPLDKIMRDYIITNRQLLYFSSLPNMLFIRYKDLFDSNYQTLKKIFNFCYLEFYPEIVTKNEERIGAVCRGRFTGKLQSRYKNNKQFRTWQINQPFRYLGKKWVREMSVEDKKTIAQNQKLIDMISRLGYNWDKFLSKYK